MEANITSARAADISDKAQPTSQHTTPLPNSPEGSAQAALSPRKGCGLLFFFGVFWPMAVLVIEMFTGLAAEIWIDPIPTYLHVAVVAWAPVANALLIWKIARRQTASPALLLWHALGIGISAIYWLAFFPFTIIGTFLFFTGFGMLPMAPMVSTLAAAVARRRYFREQGPAKRPWDGLVGVAAGIALVVALEVPFLAAAYGATLAAHGNDAQRSRGRLVLNFLASESALARYAAGETSARTHLYLDFMASQLLLPKPLPEDTARELFRASGKGPEQVAKKRVAWDQNQGGTDVGILNPQLALVESRADAAIHSEDALSYTEWTMVFQNSSSAQAEARAEILLPPGGVVSRLTLWVNGEEREAAFAGSGEVRAAYQKVVMARRDPVLVTLSAPGRALAQCFPVPPNGTMKIRFGVTAPLDVASDDSARFILPNLALQNFLVPEQTVLTLRGKLTRAPAGFVAETDQGGTFYRRVFRLSEKSVSLPVAVMMNEGKSARWVRDNRSGEGQIVAQRLERKERPPARVIAVVDGSAALGNHASQIVDALKELPNVHVLLAGAGEPMETTPEGLRQAKFRGGADNVLALRAAARLARAKSFDTILWIHGPQPVTLTDISELNTAWHSPARLVAIPLEAGRNALLEGLSRQAEVETIPLTADSGRVLQTAARRLAGKEPMWERKYERGATPPADATAREGSFHLARLWAHDEIRRLIRNHQTGEAVALAQRYQLVTAVSGAVVLETAQQFKEAGLNPANVATVPTVPEPATIALLVCGAALLAAKHRRK